MTQHQCNSEPEIPPPDPASARSERSAPVKREMPDEDRKRRRRRWLWVAKGAETAFRIGLIIFGDDLVDQLDGTEDVAPPAHGDPESSMIQHHDPEMDGHAGPR